MVLARLLLSHTCYLRVPSILFNVRELCYRAWSVSQTRPVRLRVYSPIALDVATPNRARPVAVTSHQKFCKVAPTQTCCSLHLVEMTMESHIGFAMLTLDEFLSEVPCPLRIGTIWQPMITLLDPVRDRRICMLTACNMKSLDVLYPKSMANFRPCGQMNFMYTFTAS